MIVKVIYKLFAKTVYSKIIIVVVELLIVTIIVLLSFKLFGV